MKGIVDMEVYSMNRNFQKLCQPVTNNIFIAANSSKTVTAQCTIGNNMPTGEYVLRIGVFGNNWSPLYFWSNNAATFTVKK